MEATIDVLHPDRPKRVVMVASNPAVSTVTGWAVGFWWSELTHPWWELTEHGYQVEIASPDGGALQGDSWSDPRDDSGYSSHDLISLGFIESPHHAPLVETTTPLDGVAVDDFDAVLFVGGQGPMFTFADNHLVHGVLTGFHEAGKPTGVICHATAVLLTARRPDGSLLVEGKTWTGFANSEEQFADDFVGRRIAPNEWPTRCGRSIPSAAMKAARASANCAARQVPAMSDDCPKPSASQQRRCGRATGREHPERDERRAGARVGVAIRMRPTSTCSMQESCRRADASAGECSGSTGWSAARCSAMGTTPSRPVFPWSG